jgi:hypothetical protein
MSFSQGTLGTRRTIHDDILDGLRASLRLALEFVLGSPLNTVLARIGAVVQLASGLTTSSL